MTRSTQPCSLRKPPGDQHPFFLPENQDRGTIRRAGQEGHQGTQEAWVEGDRGVAVRNRDEAEEGGEVSKNNYGDNTNLRDSMDEKVVS